MDLGLKGKVAMIAGASKGLGFSVARALAQEGAQVSIVSRDSVAITTAADKIEKLGSRSCPRIYGGYQVGRGNRALASRDSRSLRPRGYSGYEFRRATGRTVALV